MHGMVLLCVVTLIEYNEIEIGNFYETVTDNVQNDLTCRHDNLSPIAENSCQ